MATTIAQQMENLRTPENLKKELLNYYSRGIESEGIIDDVVIDCWTEGDRGFCRVDLHLDTGVITLIKREAETEDKAIRAVWEKIFLPFC